MSSRKPNAAAEATTPTIAARTSTARNRAGASPPSDRARRPGPVRRLACRGRGLVHGSNRIAVAGGLSPGEAEGATPGFGGLLGLGEPGEMVRRDLEDDLEELFPARGLRGVRDLGGDRESGLLGVFHEARADGLAEQARRLTELYLAQLPFRHRPRVHVGPARGVSRRLSGKQVVEGAGGGVAVAERVAEIPDLRRVASREVWRYSSLITVPSSIHGRDDDRGHAVAGAVEGEVALSGRGRVSGGGTGPGGHDRRCRRARPSR